MCWFVPLIIAGASAVSQLKANDQATDAAVNSANYNAAEADREARIAGMQAQNALERGGAERESYMRSFEQEQGATAAAQGASGFAVGSGSNLSVLADQAALAKLDAETISHNAEMEAWGYKEQGRNATAQGDMYRQSAISAKKAGKTNRGTILLNAAGSAAGGMAGKFGGVKGKTPSDGMTPKSPLLEKEKIRARGGGSGLQGGSR